MECPLNSSSSSESSQDDSIDLTPTSTPIKKKPVGRNDGSSFYNSKELLTWGYNSVASIPSSAKKGLGNVAGRTVTFLNDVGGRAANSLKNAAERTASSLVVGGLNWVNKDSEPISEEMSLSLKYLDITGQLPKIVKKYVQHKITPDFMTKNNLGGSEEELQIFLEFMLEQAIGSLACYRPLMREDTDKLPMNVIKNLISIINQWISDSGLEEKLITCRRLHVITQQSIKNAIKSYQINYLEISKNKNNVDTLTLLKTVHDEQKKRLLEKRDDALKEFEESLEVSIKDLVTILFEAAKIPENEFSAQGAVYTTLNLNFKIRSEVEEYLTEFIRDFYLKALPRGTSNFNHKKSELDVVSSKYDHLSDKITLFYGEDNSSDYQSLDSDNDFDKGDNSETSECSLLTGSESESEEEKNDWLIRTNRDNQSQIALCSINSKNTCSSEFLLEEVIEPELPLLQRGILGIIQVVLFKYTNSLFEEVPKKKAVQAVKEILSKYGVTEVELWISQVLMGLGVSEDPLIVQFRSILVECLAYRFIDVIEKLASLKPRAGLDLLESLLLNSIEFTNDHLHIDEEFSSDLKEYEKWVLQDEILELRDHYLQSQWKAMAEDCDDQARDLRSADAKEMFKLEKCDPNKIQGLLESLGIELPKGDPSKIETFFEETKLPLMAFLQSSRKVIQEKLQVYITKHFGQFAEKLLEAAGLDKDEGIGFSKILDLPKIRTQTFPKLILDAYCFVADLEKRPLQNIQDQILIRFIEKYSEQKKSESFENDSLLFGDIFKAFDKKRFMSDDEIKQFSDMLAQAGYTWFTVVNSFMEQQLHVTESVQEDLKVLDPNNKLPDFCESLRNKILVVAKKKIIQALSNASNPAYIPIYDALHNNGEIHKFAELYLDALLLRIFTKLACEWEENERLPNGLFANILKKTLHAIQGCEDQSLMTDTLLASIGINAASDLQIIALPFGNGKIEKLAFEEVKKQLPLLLNELYSGFLIPDQEIILKIKGRKALEEDAAILSKNMIPIAFHWMGEEKNRISLAGMIKDLLDENEIEEVDRAWLEELLVETSLMEYDKWSLILDIYERRDKYLDGCFGKVWEREISRLETETIEKIFEVWPRYDKMKRKALLKAIIGPVNGDPHLQVEDEIFIKFFRGDGRKEAERQKLLHTAGKDQVQNLWAFFEKILTPRLFRVFEHAAHYDPQATGNILERVLVNSICVIVDAFQGKSSLHPDQFKAAVIEYDRLSLLVEAYDWRNRYLKEVKGIKAAQCEDAAKNLELDQIIEICEGNFDRKKYFALLRAIGQMPEDSQVDDDLVEKLLLDFFHSSSLETRKNQKLCLYESFGPASESVLKLTGLTSDAAFFLPGASEDEKGYYTLKSVRTQVVPQILLNFYRDMSDFRGLHERNMQEFAYFFGDQEEVATQFLSTFSQIAAVKAKIYLTENRENIAKMICELFPTAPLKHINLIANALLGLSSSNLEGSDANDSAAEVIHRMIEERIFGSLIHFSVSLIRQEGDLDLSEEEDLVGDENSGLTFFERTFSPKRNLKEHFSVKSKSKFQKPKQDLKAEFEERIYSNAWFSRILQSLGDLFSAHRKALITSMKEYWSVDLDNLSEWQQDERARKLQAIFLPIASEFIKMSGLSSKNLNLPEFCQADIWETLTEEMLPKLIAKFYIEVTVLQNSQKEEALKLKEILPHGPGVAVGFAHLIVEMLKSNLAIDGNGIGEDLHSLLTDFLIDSKLESGRLAAKGLGVEKKVNEPIEITSDILENKEPIQNDLLKRNEIRESRSKLILNIENKNIQSKNTVEMDDSDLIKASINEIISDAVRSGKLSSLFSAIESHVVPHIQRIFSAMTLNLNPINDRPEVLKKIAENCILAAGDHFKRLHSVAVKEGKSSAYELVDSPSTLLKGVSLDRPILEYVFLKEKKLHALQAYRDAKGREDLWYVTETMQAERKETTKKAGETLSNSRKALRRYVREKWTDRGVAVQQYLAAERNLRSAELLVASQKEGAGQWYDNWFDSENGMPTLIEAQIKRHSAEMELDQAILNLEEVKKNVSVGQIDAKTLKNLCSMEAYRQARTVLEDAEKDWEASIKAGNKVEEAKEKFDEASKAFEKYRIKEYFKPLSEKLLKLVGKQPFEELGFPEELPLAAREKMIEKIKDKLPEVLNTIFHTLVKPETQQGILLKFLKDANKATAEAKETNVCEKAVAADGKPEREKSEADDDFENRCGSMALDLIEMLPKGSLEIFHRLQTVKDAIKLDGGKYIGDNLSSSLEETSLVELFDSLLKLALTSSMPQGTWDKDEDEDEDDLKFTPLMEGLPMNPVQVAEAKANRVIEAKKIKKDLQNEITLYMENEIASPINASLKEAGKGFMAGVKGLIESIFGEKTETAEYVFTMFENFAEKVHALCDALVKFIASLTFWPVARWFIGTMPQDITETLSLEAHEHLVFEWVNIVMDTIDEELEKLAVNNELELDI
ncbi:MAG: hypothetical protein H0T62_12855 [Parachlamydiaceae bacterium]|nr:hypothetical protein [Parachlamydiaceae bacterium]